MRSTLIKAMTVVAVTLALAPAIASARPWHPHHVVIVHHRHHMMHH